MIGLVYITIHITYCKYGTCRDLRTWVGYRDNRCSYSFMFGVGSGVGVSTYGINAVLVPRLRQIMSIQTSSLQHPMLPLLSEYYSLVKVIFK